MKIYNFFSWVNERLYETPERALDEAYRSALKIKDIEDRHFKGQSISYNNAQYSSRVVDYFQTELKRLLKNIKIRVTEFNLSQNIINFVNPSKRKYGGNGDVIVFSDLQSSLVVEKLEFIELITSKYNKYEQLKDLKSQKTQIKTVESMKNSKGNQKIQKVTGQPGKNSVVPRSFLASLNKLKQEVEPESDQAEENIIRQFRESRYQTNISIRFILILIIVPIFVHQASKTLVLDPALKSYFDQRERMIFLNNDLRNEAIQEFKEYQEELEFQSFLGIGEPIKAEEKEEQMKEKAIEISQEYEKKSINAIANIFADTLAFLSIVLVLVLNRKELEIVKDFFNRFFYNISDSAKAFILILSTDIFVGFHSPHGWEVIIESFLRHFGLPENRDFSNLFIATFPVILDTVFKYWIFKYLNGLSPSSVATYKNMNE